MLKMNLRHASKLFSKIVNRNLEKEDADDVVNRLYKLSNLEKPDKKTIVGKTIEIDNKTIYPVVDVVVISNKMQKFLGAEISPSALIIEESGEEYLLSLDGTEIDPEELAEKIYNNENNKEFLSKIIK